MKTKKIFKKINMYLGFVKDENISGWSIHYNVATNRIEMRHESTYHGASVKFCVTDGEPKVTDVYFHDPDQVTEARSVLDVYLNKDEILK